MTYAYNDANDPRFSPHYALAKLEELRTEVIRGGVDLFLLDMLRPAQVVLNGMIHDTEADRSTKEAVERGV